MVSHRVLAPAFTGSNPVVPEQVFTYGKSRVRRVQRADQVGGAGAMDGADSAEPRPVSSKHDVCEGKANPVVPGRYLPVEL